MVTNNAWNSEDPAQVAKGGTGRASQTAYAVICGGTTTTAAQQSVASVGTANQVLTSNGAGALPTFQNVSVTGAITSVVSQVFTSNGTYTPTSGMVYCEIEVIGGGGAGGGANTTTGSQYSNGGGGGAGEYARGIFDAATVGASQTVTIGAAGTGVSAGTGGSGGTTSVGALITGGGGAGGLASAASATPNLGVAGAGGSGGSGGNFRSNGEDGFYGLQLAATGTWTIGGKWGSSQYGAGGRNVFAAAGAAATGYGAGGGGSSNFQSTAATAGGNGTAGIVIVTEYVSA